jgi:hypothetical protein
MKRSLFTLLTILLACSVYAIAPVTREGKFNLKRCHGAVATFYIDWDNARCGEIEDGVFIKSATPIEQWIAQNDTLGEWETTVEECAKYFRNKWNDEFGRRGLRLSFNPDEATYHINLVIDGLDWGNMSGSEFGYGNSGGAILTGYMDLIDRGTGKLVARYNIRQVQGSGHVSDRFRLLLALHELVEELEEIR